MAAKNLTDENLHVTSAFQVADFTHVIGSMWPVSGLISIRVARLFYKYISKFSDVTAPSNRVVAETLRKTMLAARQEDPEQFDTWTPYMHYGA